VGDLPPQSGPTATADAGAPRRTGVTGMILHAAHDLTLTPEQSTALDSIEASLRPSEDAARDALSALRSHIVAGIRAGNLSARVTTADYAALRAATKQRADRQAVALNGLRALLSPEQREQLVLAVRARHAAHSLRPPDAPDDTAGDWTQKRLERLTDTLGLDDAQHRKVGALLAASGLPGGDDVKARKGAETARNEALLKGFANDESFDARKVDLGSTSRPGEALMGREEEFLARLVGVLTPAQRETLAASREGEL
jgi:hypothetical protein